MAYSPQNGWSEGTVIRQVDGAPHFYDVLPDGGDGVLVSIPRVLSHPGDHDVLPVQTRVLVCHLLPRGPYIHGVIPTASSIANYPLAPGGPSTLPGDRLQRSPNGNFVGALTGGVSVIGSGGMSQLRTHADGHVELFAETFTHQTAASETKVAREDGQTNWSFRLGANASENSGPLVEDAWQLRIDAGAEGDLVKIQVTSPMQQELASIHVSAGGRVTVYAADGRVENIGRDDSRVVTGTSARHVTENETVTVDGTRTESYGKLEHSVTGAENYSVSGARSTTIGANDITSITGNHITQVGKKSLHTLMGELQQVFAPVYDPRTFLQSSYQSPASWINYQGGFNFIIQPTAAGNQFNVVSSMPASVNLGVDGTAIFNPLTGAHEIIAAPGTFAVALYEPLIAWLGELLGWLDSHVHGSAVGPTTTPVVPSTPLLSTNLVALGSQRVRVGL